ncbi:bifunctional pyr operon transcriptional regulator/uracil phosphoribosyltransferase PyrR [Rufibacter roseus]|uniref:Bifunctional pyr operon transcriptional regulator/uracil phosphoribosyltransferase PyrR n=1 Tax=Rufibacter roseus TaxID=1567108 RepID=A0ABW2DNR3_9BACT|nr:bifunctional pyr operon transcriptional regulator/uracil phosphoribosyltransferase PyrR [Rufibacter roseus]
MHKRLIVPHALFQIMIQRLAHQLIETHRDFSDSVILGLQPRGIYVADRLQQTLQKILGVSVQTGYLDITFHRDDFRRRPAPLAPNATKVDFSLEGKRVILVDDVLYTGRSVRAALDAMISYGRPAQVELLVLIDRQFTRDLPIEATYVGQRVDSLHSQRVEVTWQGAESPEDVIWLLTPEQDKSHATA